MFLRFEALAPSGFWKPMKQTSWGEKTRTCLCSQKMSSAHILAGWGTDVKPWKHTRQKKKTTLLTESLHHNYSAASTFCCFSLPGTVLPSFPQKNIKKKKEIMEKSCSLQTRWTEYYSNYSKFAVCLFFQHVEGYFPFLFKWKNKTTFLCKYKHSSTFVLLKSLKTSTDSVFYSSERSRWKMFSLSESLKLWKRKIDDEGRILLELFLQQLYFQEFGSFCCSRD